MTCECVRQNYQGGYSREKPGLESLWASAGGFGVMAFRAHEAVRSWGEAEARAADGADFLGGKDWKGRRPMGSGSQWRVPWPEENHGQGQGWTVWGCRLFPPISGSGFTSCEVPGNTTCLWHHTSILKCSAKVSV